MSEIKQNEEIIDINSLPKYSLNSILLYLIVLSIIKENQLQNGLRYDNYQRYHQYCSHKLNRLRKLLHINIKQFKNKPFTMTVITPEIINDEKFLLIPLNNSERAWSFAMELKQSNDDLRSPRIRYHLVRRLSKAVKCSTELRDLCRLRCDKFTILESEAYLSWMIGNYLLEKEDYVFY